MSRRKIWIALAGVVAFAGGLTLASSSTVEPPVLLAQAQPPQVPATGGRVRHKSTKQCSTTTGKCELTVTVTACTPDGITIDHDVLGVLPGTRDIDIDWTITTPGYFFHQDNGIKFKGDEWRKEFDRPRAHRNEFHWRDRNNAGGLLGREYDYSLTITKDDGSPCATKDPTVVNDET